MPTARRHFQSSPRRGTVLLVVMILTLVVSMLLVVGVQAAVRRQRELKLRAWEVQAAWLAEAGLERAVARLIADDAYTGETWTIAPIAPEQPAGIVEIKIEVVDGLPELRVASATATYPNAEHHRARTTKRAPLNMNLLRDAK